MGGDTPDSNSLSCVTLDKRPNFGGNPVSSSVKQEENEIISLDHSLVPIRAVALAMLAEACEGDLQCWLRG